MEYGLRLDDISSCISLGLWAPSGTSSHTDISLYSTPSYHEDDQNDRILLAKKAVGVSQSSAG